MVKFTKTAQTGRNETKKLGYIGDKDHQAKRVYDEEGKLPALNVVCNSMVKSSSIRKLTPVECERLQSLPDNYTEGIAKTNRYKCLGNAFNVEVVAHILRSLV
jgi:site-specific DNA-cytosine methylase